MKPVKETSFIEAVAAAIQHEKDFFDFCMKSYDELPKGPVKDFFFDMAEDGEEHIAHIEEIHKRYQGGKGLPNLKHLSTVHKFQATAIQKLMKKLDRNKKKSGGGNDIEAMRLAQQEAEDASISYQKLADKFTDHAIRTLFRQMAAFNAERAALLEGAMVFHLPKGETDRSQDFHSAAIEELKSN